MMMTSCGKGFGKSSGGTLPLAAAARILSL
jgi:hypothetical protein